MNVFSSVGQKMLKSVERLANDWKSQWFQTSAPEICKGLWAIYILNVCDI